MQVTIPAGEIGYYTAPPLAEVPITVQILNPDTGEWENYGAIKYTGHVVTLYGEATYRFVLGAPGPACCVVYTEVEAVDATPVVEIDGDVSGIPGPTGATGSQGEVGPAGPQGDIGLTGEVGPAGPQGLQGAVGPQGQKGDTGVDGESIVGPQGIPGPTGITGPRGNVGPAGGPGPAGPEGPEGPQGIPGPVSSESAPKGSMRLDTPREETFGDNGFQLMNVFDSITMARGGINPDPSPGVQNITTSFDGHYVVTFGFNIEVHGSDSINIMIFIDGVAASPNPLQVQGLGNGKPTSLLWNAAFNINDGLPHVFDLRAMNGDSGLSDMEFTQATFTLRREGDAYVSAALNASECLGVGCG